MGKFIDLTGKRYGRLVVIKRDDDYILKTTGMHFVQWLCECDCGNKIIVAGSRLKNGYTKSCGCLRKEMAGNTSNLKRKNTDPSESPAINRLYTLYIRNAKIRNLEFNLDIETFKDIISKNCYYCGDIPSQTVKNYDNIPYPNFKYNGIDRLNSDEGYTNENSVSCCYYCNRRKWNDDVLTFISWVEKVYNHSILHNKKN